MYRIGQIKLSLNEEINRIPMKIDKKLMKFGCKVTDFILVRESIDARDKGDIKMVYTVDFNIAYKNNKKDTGEIALNSKLGISISPDMTYKEVTPGGEPLTNRPVIVGFGPCGMFCGLILAEQGYKPLIIERGNPVDKRVFDVKEFWEKGILNTESNVQFGEGGAGTFSDGKLTTGIKDTRIRKVLETFVDAGADENILYKHKPHIGTDVLRRVVVNIRKRIIELGGEIRFSTKMTGIVAEGFGEGGLKKITAVKVISEGLEEIIETEHLVTAIGHSARDTFRQLNEEGIRMDRKPFSIGVRIEHPQPLIDKSQYGKTKGLPPAEYKLAHHCKNGRGVYTFCMCPGGQVICASSQEGGVVTNGMSNFKRDSGVANSGLLVDVRVDDFEGEGPLAGVEFQEKYERLAYLNGGSNYKLPHTTWAEFRDNKKSAAAVINSLPVFATESIREAMPFLGRKLNGFDGDNTVMKAVETRSSSPVRFDRGKNFQGTFSGFYPAGEGAGYAGGITSAACDGIKIAEEIIKNNKPIKE